MNEHSLRRAHHDRDGAAYHAAARSSTLVSVAVNLVLTVLQLVVGVLAHAQSLVADAMHTLSDLLSDFLVLYANRHSSQPADDSHPYGHGRIETVASLALGVALTAVGIGFLVSAGLRLQNLESLPQVGAAAVWTALATLVAKELLFRYQLGVAKRVRSSMLMANAWHQRADAASSLVVAAGTGASRLGWTFGDLLAAAIVGFLIARMGVRFAYGALRELVDTALNDEEVRAIRNTFAATSGVRGVHDLRTRRMARSALVDAHVLVDPYLSVSEGHRIAERARARVIAAHADVMDVLVHVDVEEDLVPPAGRQGMPDREQVMAVIREQAGDDWALLERVVLHYLGGALEVELFMSPSAGADPHRLDALQQSVAGKLAGQHFRASRIYVRHAP